MSSGWSLFFSVVPTVAGFFFGVCFIGFFAFGKTIGGRRD
jgi:hypothetical protein